MTKLNQSYDQPSKKLGKSPEMHALEKMSGKILGDTFGGTYSMKNNKRMAKKSINRRLKSF